MPDLPNRKEDPDRTTSPDKPKRKSNHELLMEYLRSRALYTAPDGTMHFEEGRTGKEAGEHVDFYYGLEIDRNGNGVLPPADGLPMEYGDAYIKPALQNRYMPAPPPPAVLKNRYTVPSPGMWDQLKNKVTTSPIGRAVSDATAPIDIEFLARQAGYLK